MFEYPTRALLERLALEQIWLDNQCRCPMNIVWWRAGKSCGLGIEISDNMFWKKGKRWPSKARRYRRR